MRCQAILWNESGTSNSLGRETIRALGHDESFLEDRIVEHPEILGLETLASGIRGPYKVFQQLSLTTPTERRVHPDIVLVSRSAHLIVVEVKLNDNPELANRSVIGQVVEYSASLAVIDRGQFVRLLSEGSPTSSLEDLARSWFPGLADPGEFADLLFERCSLGAIDLVVACDRCPMGLENLGVGLDRQSALAFRLQVIEVEPWVSPDLPGRILFLNRPRVRTEIIGRTLVEVNWQGPEAPPEVSVVTTSLDQVEEALEAAREEKRGWSASEIREYIETSSEVEDADRSMFLRLLELAVNHSHGGQITNQKTVHPSFCFMVQGPSEDRKASTSILWSARPSGHVFIFRRGLRSVLSAEGTDDVEHELHRMFDEPLKTGPDYITIPQVPLRDRIEEFGRLSLRVQSEAGRR